MSKHTPGPWKWEEDMEPSPVTKKSESIISTNRALSIRILGGDFYKANSISKEERIANARLIAAAPEMLEALEELLFTMTRCGYPAEVSAIQKAQEVIKKAKGE